MKLEKKSIKLTSVPKKTCQINSFAVVKKTPSGPWKKKSLQLICTEKMCGNF